MLSLYLFEGYDHEEIGEILGISVGTSKSQYSRAVSGWANCSPPNNPTHESR